MTEAKTLPTVAAESYVTIAPDLTIKVVVLSDGQRVIPVEEYRKACEWLGVDPENHSPDVMFKEPMQ